VKNEVNDDWTAERTRSEPELHEFSLASVWHSLATANIRLRALEEAQRQL
jgi:hypothetical protein